MKNILLSIALIATLLCSVIGFVGCEPEVAPGAYPSSIIPTTNGTKDIGRSNKQWRDICLYRYIRTSGGSANLTLPTSSDTLVGLATEDTLTNKTLTAPTINAATITGTVTMANGVTLTTPVILGATINGTVTIATGTTLTDPVITGATINGTVTIADGCTITTPSISSPTITGTSVVSNSQSGVSGNFTAGSGTGVVVTHNMAGTPIRIFLSWAADEGGDISLYSSSINATSFTINPTANVTNGVQVYWLAYILDE